MSDERDVSGRFPNITTLLGAYFHQDFDFDYGSYEGTIDAFMLDLGSERCAQSVAEVTELLASSTDEDLRTFLQRSGNSFAYETRGLDARGWLLDIATRVRNGRIAGG